MNEIVDQINDNLRWLEDNVKSDNIMAKSICLDKINLLTMTLSKDVTEAYALMNELEDDYKIAVDKFIAGSSKSVNKAEVEARAEFAEKKRAWTQAKNIFKKLDNYLDRIDRISDGVKQSISVVKQASMKNIV